MLLRSDGFGLAGLMMTYRGMNECRSAISAVIVVCGHTHAFCTYPRFHLISPAADGCCRQQQYSAERMLAAGCEMLDTLELVNSTR